MTCLNGIQFGEVTLTFGVISLTPPPQRVVDFLSEAVGIHNVHTARIIAASSSEQLVGKNEILLQSGERQQDIWVLIDGRIVKLSATSPGRPRWPS